MANQGLTSSSSGAIPLAPSFADFKFSTIGQDPPLLKRISSQSLDLHSPYPSSPAPGELEYPSAVEPPRPQSSTYSNTFLGNDATGPITCTASQCSDARDTRFAESHKLPHAQGFAPSQHASAALSAVPRNVMAQGAAPFPATVMSSSQKQTSSISASPLATVRTPVIGAAPIKHQTPLPASTVHQMNSSYAALRALQGRLMTSLSKLHPPDMTNALLRIQTANSHSVNALTTAHRSQILAQQSLATAQEAVAAAQECLSAAEQARTHTNVALTTIRQLHSGKVDFDAEGTTEWEWKVNFIQLQDDLRMLGEWLVAKESEDPTSRDAQCARSIVKDRSAEVSQPVSAVQNRNIEASRVSPHSDLPSNGDGALFREAQQSANLNETLSSQRQGTLPHLSEDEAHTQTRVEEARLLKLQREHVTSEVSENAVNGSQPRPSMATTANGTKTSQQSQSSVIAEDADRALPMHGDNEVAFAEASKFKRESHRILEELKQRQSDEPEKEEEQLTADEERELFAEQERRRQEVMAQKQRVTAEIAAKINAERAREKEKAKVASLQSPTSTAPQPSLHDCPVDSENLSAKKSTPFKPTKKVNSLSCRDRSGPTTNGHSQPTVPSYSFPHPPIAPAALRWSSSKTQAFIDRGFGTPKAGNHSSSEKSSQDHSGVTFRTPTPTNGINGGEELHVYRHSNDPGNLCLIPCLQVIPARPEAQAANLRHLKNGNCVGWDKPDPEDMNQSSLHQRSPIKKESPIPATLVESKTQIATEPFQSVHSPPSFLPTRPFSTASLPSNGHPISNQYASMDQHGVKGTTEAAPTSSATETSSAMPSPITRRPLSNVTPPNPHRDDLSSTRNNSKPLLTSNPMSNPPTVPLTTPLAPLDMSAINHSDGTQIAPVIHANGGWDRPVDGEMYSGDSIAREPTPERPRQFTRGDDHYSPSRAPTPDSYKSRGYVTRSVSTGARSPLSPVRRSPVLGKRRQREDNWEDEHPPRRHLPTDGTRRTRSPLPRLRQSVQRRSPSPDCPTLPAKMQDTYHHNTSRARSPPSREHGWRSPPPNRPALQSRIGVPSPVGRAIHGGRSYRPTYSSGISERARSRTRDNYPARQAEQSGLGQRSGTEVELRGSYYNRSRGGMSIHRVSPRQGDRGGKRSLNLEQRIASPAKPWTLINRLESPQRD
ncbi:hypothetical protein C0992_009370 [Termitomyces sp. T32_za158]|nr:hypothetical protein C0992_009370 [Termitomyces sp. T32_za158]